MIGWNNGRKRVGGYTFLEVVVSTAIFLTMTAAISKSFVSGFSAYRGIRAVQRDIETAQFSMNTLAKSLRTSSVVAMGLGANPIWRKVVFYDYSQQRCFDYAIDSGALEARFATVATIVASTGISDPRTACANYSFSETYSVLTSGYVTGKFYVVQSSNGAPKVSGRVVISLTVKDSSAGTTQSLLQTSVSLRDYNYVKM